MKFIILPLFIIVYIVAIVSTAPVKEDPNKFRFAHNLEFNELGFCDKIVIDVEIWQGSDTVKFSTETSQKMHWPTVRRLRYFCENFQF